MMERHLVVGQDLLKPLITWYPTHLGRCSKRKHQARTSDFCPVQLITFRSQPCWMWRSCPIIRRAEAGPSSSNKLTTRFGTLVPTMCTEPSSQPTKMLSPLIEEEHNERTIEVPTTNLSINSILAREIRFTPPYSSPTTTLSTIPPGPTRPSNTLAWDTIFTLICLPLFGFQTIVASSIATTQPSAVTIERITVLNCLMTTKLLPSVYIRFGDPCTESESEH